MTNSKQSPEVNPHDQVSKILGQATRRAPAPADVRERAYKNLHAHWMQNIDRKHSRSLSWVWGVAAAVLLALGVVFIMPNQPADSNAFQVAQVVRAAGNQLQVIQEAGSTTTSLTSSDKITIGSLISTGEASRLAIRWGAGGSLRVDENTRIEILARNQIRLLSGTVYFDSKPEGGLSNSSKLISVDTPFGLVTHLGTQFTTHVGSSVLQVNVREGQVQISNGANEHLASAGNGLDMHANGTVRQQEISTYGQHWAWVQEVAPAFDSEGRSARALLNWIARETGYMVEYRDQRAMQVAASAILVGMNPLGPMQALEALPYATDLKFEIQDGVIHIGHDEA